MNTAKAAGVNSTVNGKAAGKAASAGKAAGKRLSKEAQILAAEKAALAAELAQAALELSDPVDSELAALAAISGVKGSTMWKAKVTSAGRQLGIGVSEHVPGVWLAGEGAVKIRKRGQKRIGKATGALAGVEKAAKKSLGNIPAENTADTMERFVALDLL